MDSLLLAHGVERSDCVGAWKEMRADMAHWVSLTKGLLPTAGATSFAAGDRNTSVNFRLTGAADSVEFADAAILGSEKGSRPVVG